MPESEVLNASQAAVFFGVHVQMIRRLARSKRIPGFKVSTATRHAPLMLPAKPIDPELFELTVRTAIGPKAALVAKGSNP